MTAIMPQTACSGQRQRALIRHTSQRGLRADSPFLSHKNHLVATKSKCCRRRSSRKCRLLVGAMPAAIDGKILYGCVLLY
jgi:hypothetical protein